MTSPRASATATLLRNGKVLVAGGLSAPALPTASAELYNPATGRWAATGPMTAVRSGQTATLLASGEVLVAGGSTTGGFGTASAELYDPATGTWAATGPMVSAPGSGATATLLPGGRVLLAGGCCVPGGGLPTALASAQIYNPVANTWATTASMSIGRDNATATLLGNGTVLVAGGQHLVKESSGGVTSAEIYDPATGTWHSTGTMPTGHGLATASLLPGGRVLVAGGALVSGCCGGIVAADLYDPSTGTWQAAANMNVAREDAASAVLPDGTVLMTGGYTGITPMPDVASTEIYQPATNTWTPGPDMAQGRAGQTATLLPDGQVLVAGGGNQDGILATAELYSPGTAVNLIPDAGFESPAVPSGYWRSTLARTSAVAHSGTWSLAQTTSSSHGGWDLDADAGWYAPISPAKNYQASIWVRASKAVKVDLNVDLLGTAGNYVSNISGHRVALGAGTWTQLTLTGIKPVPGEAYAAVQTHYAKAAAGTVIYWDDMSLTSPGPEPVSSRLAAQANLSDRRGRLGRFASRCGVELSGHILGPGPVITYDRSPADDAGRGGPSQGGWL